MEFIIPCMEVPMKISADSEGMRVFKEILKPIIDSTFRSKDKKIAINIPNIRTTIKMRSRSSDLPAFIQIFVNKEYELPIKIAPNLIIDGGANVGYASIWFANKYPAAEILAVEPEESNFQLLKENTAQYPNIRLVNAGIWSRKADLTIRASHFKHSGKWDFYLEECENVNKKTRIIKAVTISDLLNSSAYKRIDILKLDVEGAEKEIFTETYKDWLDKVSVLIIELHDRYKPNCTQAFYSAVGKYNFRKHQKGENIFLIKQNA